MSRAYTILALTVGVVSIAPVAARTWTATAHFALERPLELQQGQPAECERQAADLLARNPNRECRFPTGVTISGGGRGISMRIRTVSSSQGGALVGFAFGSSDSGGDHVFAVSQDGLYQLTHKVGGKVTWLIDPSSSPAIRTGPGSDNQLKVLWTDDGLIRCFINDRYVGGGRAVTSLDGGISYYAAGGVRATFENYALQNSPQVPPDAPTPGRVMVSDDMLSRRGFQAGGERVCRASYDGEGTSSKTWRREAFAICH